MIINYSFIAAVLVAFVSPSAAGSGIPEVKAYLNGISQPELLTFKTLVTKIVGVCFSVGGGTGGKSIQFNSIKI